MFVLNVLMDII